MVRLHFPLNLLFLFTVAFTLNATSLSRMKDKRLDHPETAFKTMKQRLLHDSQFGQNQHYAVGNPYILACNSSRQCLDTTLHECLYENPQDPNTWYCNCWCDGFGPCRTNRDCCNNNCINGICSENGGTQGTVCTKSCSSCAPDYVCQLWCNSSYHCDTGYCNYQDNTTHLSTISDTLRSISTTSTLTTPDGNPWIYLGCPNGDIDCQNTTYKNCHKTEPTDPSTWFCGGSCDGDPCYSNKDCPNNDCVNGFCSLLPGSQGTFCHPSGMCANCSSNYFCNSWPPGTDYGYCDYI